MSRGKLLVAGVWLLSGAAVSAQTLSEQEALARMRAEYPGVAALRLGVRELAAELEGRTVLSNPSVSYTREDTGRTTDDFLLVSQELPLRGRRQLLGEAARHRVSAADARADSDVLVVEAALRLAFTDLLVSQARARSLNDGVSQLHALAAVLRTREEQGEGSRFDRLRVEHEVAEVDTDLASSQIDRRVAQARLALFFAVGTDPDRLIAGGSLDAYPALPDTTVPATKVVERRPDYRALTLQEAGWATERRAAKRRRLPGAQLIGGMKRADGFGSSDTGYVVTASFSVPLFNRGQAQVARAEAGRARVEAERQALAARIAADLYAAAATAAQYRELADRYRDDSLEPAMDLVTIATAAYEEGEYGILELLDAHRVRLRASLRLLELSAAARRAAIDLDRAVGRGMPQ